MMRMAIWLDVTTTLYWKRPAVGITRVESECARHFMGQSQVQVRFCRFDRTTGHYAEVNRTTVVAYLERPEPGWEEPTASGSKSSDRLTLWKSSKRNIKR